MKSVEKLTVVSRLELATKNGAGLRLVSSLLDSLNIKANSLFWGGNSSTAQSSIRLNKTNTFKFWMNSLSCLPQKQPILMLPDSIQDCFLMFALLFSNQKILVWVMDDFIQLELNSSSGTKRFLKSLFIKTFLKLSPQVAFISKEMKESYEHKYIIDKTLILHPAKPIIKSTNSNNNKKLSPNNWVYMGKIKDHYMQPLSDLPIEFLSKHNIHIDIYSDQNQDSRLNSKYFSFKGSFKEKDKLNILNQYKVSVLSYSSDKQSVDLFRHSFPSKLLDYAQAELAVICFSPKELLAHKLIIDHKIGICPKDLHLNTLEQAFNDLENNYEKYSGSSLVFSIKYNFPTLAKTFSTHLESR